jgi:hypothetical protein
MLPLIREGDRLLVSHNLATLHRGSVVVFWQGERLIAHRLLRIIPASPPRFVTKGDNSWGFDEISTADDLLGHVLTLQRGENVIALDSRKWRAIGWLVATATLAVAIPYDALRSVKQRLGGHKTLPGIRLVRWCLQAILTMVLRPFVRSVVGTNVETARNTGHKKNLIPKTNDAP